MKIGEIRVEENWEGVDEGSHWGRYKGVWNRRKHGVRYRKGWRKRIRVADLARV